MRLTWKIALGIAAATAALGIAGAQAAGAAGVLRKPQTSPTFDGTVWSVAFRGENVYVGGSFGKAIVNGRSYPRSRLAAFNARTGALLDWAPQANGIAGVRTLATNESLGAIVAGGEFTTMGGVTQKRLAVFG